ncbi:MULTISPECIES: WYL domain-containing protein [Helicobacter]|uniref:WYL domain-containing protein n=1 Tax=Helicobacter TaxID=209 RepID=UPI000EAE5116|nr:MULTISPECIES: WYL domain-containing protein [Helicobacter]
MLSLITLSGAQSLYPSLEPQFLNDLLQTPQTLVVRTDFEEIASAQQSFMAIKEAILQHRVLSFSYKNKPRQANPYKLLNKHGIWYLLAEEQGCLKTFTLKKISALEVLDARFSPQAHTLAQLDKHPGWFCQHPIKATLRIQKAGVPYFLRKCFFAHQETCLLDNGDLEVSVRCAYEDEILNFIRAWIPYAKLLTPKCLQAKLKAQLQAYLQELDP